jgi:streptogramin lyase
MIVELSVEKKSLVYRYRTDTHHWTSYASIEGVPIIPETLVVTPDGNLWGIGRINNSQEIVSSTWPLISRFDEATDQFRFVYDEGKSLQTFYAHRSPPMVQSDNSGNLWLIINQGFTKPSSLYSFNPKTAELTQHLPEIKLSGYGSLAISANNDIWIFDPNLETKIIQFHPSTGAYRDNFLSHSDWHIENWNGDLYYDNSGKLWSGIDGWLDFTNPVVPVWHRIIPSAILISPDYYDVEDQSIWTHPSYIYQSSNGWYWFSFPNNGIMRLDTQTGSWCKFTTQYSPVVEDSQKNIRIVMEGKIYLLSLN